MKPHFMRQLLLCGFLARIPALVDCAPAAPRTPTAPPARRVSPERTLPQRVSPPKVYDTSAALLSYQRALDRLAGGHVTEARALVEEALRRCGDAPELNLLLGYLLQREGRVAEARERLVSVAPQSPLAAEYAAQLKRSAATSTASAAAAPSTTSVMSSRAAPPAAPPVATVTPIRVAQGDVRLANLELALLQLVNTERKKAGIEELIVDETLAGVARAHSAEMRDRTYFAHESPTATLRQPLDRYRAVFEATPRLIAENVYRAWGKSRRFSRRDVQEAHAALMKSPSHRANILLPNITRIGIGIVSNATGDLWITQMFVRL